MQSNKCCETLTIGQKFLQQEIIAQNNKTQHLADGLFCRRYNRHHKIEY